MLIIKCNQCLVYKQIDPVHTGRFPTKVVMPALPNWPAGCVVVILLAHIYVMGAMFQLRSISSSHHFWLIHV